MTKQEFVSMSLPCGLKVLIPESDNKYCRKTVIGTVGAVFDDGSINCFDTVNACPRWYKPVLYRLTDIVKFNLTVVDHYLSCSTIVCMETGCIGLTDISAYELQFLVGNHFDIAGLIDKGQAIDVNSLDVNPYSGRVNTYKKK